MNNRKGKRKLTKKARARLIKNWIIALLFVLPALLNFAVFRYYPIFWSFRTSLWKYSLLGGFDEFVGFDNYARAFTDSTFIKSLGLTGIFTFFKVSFQVVLAMALALFVNQKKRGMGFARMVIFIPVVTSYIVVAVIWGMLLNKDYGLLNSLLSSLGFERMEYLTSQQNAFPILIVISVWKDVGYSMILLVAGMKGIPGVFYEAADMDGASVFEKLRYITIPMLRRTIMFILVTTTIGAFQIFIPVYQLTKGGPRRSTMVTMYYIYQEAFNYGEMGYASALSIILLVILLIISLGQMRLLRSE
jgi:ABC-type sugar transport system permease subunit